MALQHANMRCYTAGVDKKFVRILPGVPSRFFILCMLCEVFNSALKEGNFLVDFLNHADISGH